MADYNPTGRPRIQSGVLRETSEHQYSKHSIAGSSAKFDNDVAEVTSNLFDLLIKKHKDYGPKNISQSPGGPLNGLRVRMWDKLARINNLVESGAKPENESLEDSFKDMANYAIIGLLVLQGKWPNE
jgi:hypothetical protein